MSSLRDFKLVRNDQWLQREIRKADDELPDFRLQDYVTVNADGSIIVNDSLKKKPFISYLGITHLLQTSIVGELLLEQGELKLWELRLIKIIAFKTQSTDPKYDYFWVSLNKIVSVLHVERKTLRSRLAPRGKFSLSQRGFIRFAGRCSTQHEVKGNTRKYGLALTREAYILLQKPPKTSSFSWKKWYTNL